MIKENDKSQEKDNPCHSAPLDKRVSQRSKSFLIFCIAAVFLVAMILWWTKSFLPSAPKSTSGSKPTIIDRTASKQKAADFLKKELLEITELLIEEFPANERLRTLAVEVHQVCLNHNQAKALLEEGISMNPGHGDFYEKLARIAAKEGEPTILRNDTKNKNHWLQIRLVGTKANRDGVGAKVKVVAGDLVRVDEVHSGRGYQGHFGMRLHFGLGQHKKADRVEVSWIGGGLDVFENIIADQLITLIEGSSKKN